MVILSSALSSVTGEIAMPGEPAKVAAVIDQAAKEALSKEFSVSRIAVA
jgi:hypothetical protein